MESDWDVNKSGTSNWSGRKSVVIVAHPDDETLWCGGIILMHPEADWYIITLCRRSDTDRAPKFKKILHKYNAAGVMADMDDGPEQTPLNIQDIEEAILDLLPEKEYDLIITHSPRGEYTRHKRHEEVAEAVLNLLKSKCLNTSELWMFAYQDNNRQDFPKPITAADVHYQLPQAVWNKKYELITKIYGFSADSWEAQATPKTEAFWIFTSVENAKEQIHERSKVL